MTGIPTRINKSKDIGEAMNHFGGWIVSAITHIQSQVYREYLQAIMLNLLCCYIRIKLYWYIKTLSQTCLQDCRPGISYLRTLVS